nr:peroxisome biogenesis protein 16-like [Coffea arabica]
MEAYKRWVRRNKDYVHSMESLANGLTWLLPERFSDSEIGPEAVTSFFGIITAINEHIIETTPTQRVTGQAETSSFPYSLCITLLKDLETLVEVAAQHFYGDDRKWNFIAATEAIKVLVRLAMIKNSGYKMLLRGGETVYVEKGLDAVNYSKQRHGELVDPRSHNLKNHFQHTPWNLEGKALSALSRFGENARMVSERTWLSRVQHQQAIMEPPTLMVEKPSLSTFLSEKGVPGGLFVMGEVMFVVRPLLYVLLIRKYGTRSWFPWVMSLGVDLIGNGILSAVAVSRNSRKGPLFYLSNDERDELKRRKLLWALYLMRDPFFTKYTRKRLDHTQKLLEPVPVIGFFAEKLIELLVGAQTRYTYMSGS